MRRSSVVAALILSVGCGTSSTGAPATSPAPSGPGQLTVTPRHATPDSSAGTLIPAGYGSLKQDDIAIVLQPSGLRVTAIPLDESILRVLAPDSYHTLHSIVESRRSQIEQRAAIRGIHNPSVWLFTFTGLIPDARFVPSDVTINSGGRDYRPFDVIGISSGFAEQRVQPREIQRGLLLFDDRLDVTQPLTVSIDTEQNTDWAGILQRIDAERSSVRARAAGRP